MVSSIASWHSPEPLKYTIVLVLANLAAGWKIGLPAFPGTTSVGTLFVLVGIAEFSLPETMVMGTSSVLTQFLLHERASWKGLIFRIANIGVAITSAYYVYVTCAAGVEPAPLWPLVPAVLTFALLNTFAAAVEHARTRENAVVEIWHECGFWTLPYYLLSAAIAAGMSWISAKIGWPYGLAALPLMLFSYYRAYSHIEAIRARRSGTERLVNHHHRTVETLALAIAARFRTANDQFLRTQAHSMTLAGDLELPEDEREALRIASVMHDVGMLAVPEQIVGKAGRLSAEEFERIKVHPEVGAEIIEQSGFPYPVAKIVRHHHERWDGQGYPDGLLGEAIPLAARILTAVDCLVSLTTDRNHRQAIGFDRALSFVTSQSGTAFDPRVVAALQERAGEFHQAFEAAVGPREAEPRFVASISNARRESQQIYALAQQLGTTLELSETLETVDRHMPSILCFDALAVYLLRDGVLLPEYASGAAKPTIFSSRITTDNATSGAAARLRRTIPNGKPEDDFGGQQTPLQSALAMPLNGADGVIGVLTVYRQEANAFTGDDIQMLQGIQGIVAAAVENAIRFEKAEASATTDNLTGLPNARSLFQRLETEVARCKRSQGSFAVVVCDLNGFKHVNDRFGHIAGNHVLQATGGALQMHCREYDYVARLGGDEFVILLPGLPDSALEIKLRHLSRVVAEAAEGAVPGGGVTLSAGCARYPVDGTDAESLLSNADAKMYEDKRSRQFGHPGFVFDSSPAMLKR